MASLKLENPSSVGDHIYLSDWPALCVFALLFFTVGLQFFTRYVLNDSLGWTEELARYQLILLGFLGGIVCARNNSHIHLEFLHHWLPPVWLRRVLLFCRFITAGFFGYCGVLALELAARTESRMASLPLPRDLLYYLVCAGCIGIAGYTLLDAWRVWRSPPQQLAEALSRSQTTGM